MKLYVYDHCPYCVRARMPFAMKGIPFELVVLPNDDEATPIGMIGAKMLPILEDEDGFMGESLDIVRKIDGLSAPRLFDAQPDAHLVAWLDQWNSTVNGLVIPRTPDPWYEEFRRDSAVAYFTAKKEATFGDFPGLIARTGEFMARLDEALTELVPLLPEAEKPSIDHILLFPILRSLTVVPNIAYPPAVKAWMDTVSRASSVPLVTR